eukprot:5566272-Prymnesium_polylepis.1
MLAVCSDGRVLHTSSTPLQSSHPTPHKRRPPLRSPQLLEDLPRRSRPQHTEDLPRRSRGGAAT